MGMCSKINKMPKSEKKKSEVPIDASRRIRNKARET